MKKLLFLFALIISMFSSWGQSKGYIVNDSTYFEKRGGNAEMILENGTRDTPGFLYNKGGGRTIFKRGLIRIDDTTYLIGHDTLHTSRGIDSKNIGNSDLIATGNRHFSGSYTHSLWFDSLSGFNLTGSNGTFFRFNDNANTSPGVVSIGDVDFVSNKTRFLVDDQNLITQLVSQNGFQLHLGSFAGTHNTTLQSQSFDTDHTLYLPSNIDFGTDTIATRRDLRDGNVVANIYNTDGILPGDRKLELNQHVLNISDSLNYNSIKFFTTNAFGGTRSGTGSIDFTSAYGIQQFQVGGDSTHGGINWNGASNQGYLVFSPSGARWNDQSGTYIIFNIPSTTDTTKKALVYDPVSNALSYMDLWSRAGGGGGVAADVVTTITSGTSSTVPDGTNIIRFNNTSPLTYTLTLGTNWHSSHDLLIAFTSNGTITNGNPMVTLTVVNGSGHTQSFVVDPSGVTYKAGENIGFHLIGTVEQRVAK